MTRAVLFDLGNTLLDEQTNRPLPGATGLLDALGDVRDSENLPVLSGLVSDWKMPRDPSEVGPLRQEYLQELVASGLHTLFRPLETRITLSTEVGVRNDEDLLRPFGEPDDQTKGYPMSAKLSGGSRGCGPCRLLVLCTESASGHRELR